jgi:hypothetical protein
LSRLAAVAAALFAANGNGGKKNGNGSASNGNGEKGGEWHRTARAEALR